MPLRHVGESFKLDVTKDIMPYPIYTQENINKVYVPIFSTLPYVKPADEKQFLDNIDKCGCRGTGHLKHDFNIITYSSKYCEMDCTVLKKDMKHLDYGCLNIQN